MRKEEPVRDRHGLLVGGAGQAGQENPMIAALDKLGVGASDSDSQSRTSLQVLSNLNIFFPF